MAVPLKKLFTPFSSASIVDFGQVNVSSEPSRVALDLLLQFWINLC